MPNGAPRPPRLRGSFGEKTGEPERRAIEVEAARFIAVRIAAVEQDPVVRPEGEDAGAGELVLVALVDEVEAVQRARRIALAGEVDDALRQRLTLVAG